MEISQVACLKKVHDATLDEEFYCIQKAACLMKDLCYCCFRDKYDCMCKHKDVI